MTPADTTHAATARGLHGHRLPIDNMLRAGVAEAVGTLRRTYSLSLDEWQRNASGSDDGAADVPTRARSSIPGTLPCWDSAA